MSTRLQWLQLEGKAPFLGLLFDYVHRSHIIDFKAVERVADGLHP
jgi:hypothetical protein